ncbi:Hint domain-containing protein [Palleronia sp.]|uniref:Hint domain-containing protein n=1 Tax=Palleronia sp. TaxID=1940284 RepID=UPI0035C85890
MARTALVRTTRGEVLAGALRPGDGVFTRDNGPREIETMREEAASTRSDRAVCVRAGALGHGHGQPERDLIVAEKTRLLLASGMISVLYDTDAAVVRAGDLVGREGFRFCGAPAGGWVALGLSSHELVLVDGTWTETEAPRLAGGASTPTAYRELSRLEAQLLG